jgi:hypothetical protein
MKIIQKLILLFSVIVIVFGFYQLKHEQDIFAQSKERCCNNGMCQYLNGQGDLCTSNSGMFLKSDSCKTEYNLTCRECVDYSALGQVCDDPKNSCEDANGNCYGWCYYNGSWQWVVAK